jgi:hypothetical protein
LVIIGALLGVRSSQGRIAGGDAPLRMGLFAGHEAASTQGSAGAPCASAGSAREQDDEDKAVRRERHDAANTNPK